MASRSCRSAVLALCVLAAGGARADDQADAKAHFEKATSAFALGRFDVAATEYEKAFELKSDPALLFNAAQSHRHAGNKQRALLLYQNYLRIFRKAPNRAEVSHQIAELKQAIDAEAAQPPPPPEKTAEPAPPAPAPVVEAPAPALSATASPPPRKPLVKRAWFWGVIAGSVLVVGGAVALGVVLGRPASDPTPTLGRVGVNN
jgi:tetratricopeptide (TPR) repeat protein